jgi:hypothetical protein
MITLIKTDLEVLVCKETWANAEIPLRYYVIAAWRGARPK